MARGSEKLRALWHILFGILTILYGQVLPVTLYGKIIFVRVVGGAIVLADLCIRLPLYHFLIKPTDTDVSGWGSRRLWWRKKLIPVEAFLVRIKWIRQHERGFPAAAMPFFLGVLLPLECGVPLYAAMTGIVVLGFGDPSAREFAVWLERKKGMDLHRVWGGQKGKTWEGYLGFVLAATGAVLFTVLIDIKYGVYPIEHPFQLSVALVLGVYAGGLAELLDEIVVRKTRGWAPMLRRCIHLVFDDNFIIPVVTSSVITLVMAI